MAEVTFLGSLKEESRKDYIAIFETEWPLWVGGILLAFLAIMMILWARPWGVAAGVRNWGDWVFYFIGVQGSRPTSPLLHTTSVMNIGLLAGAVASSLMGRQFAVRRAPNIEYLKGLAGGILMGIGAALARGCNVGGFFSAIGTLSLGGFAMMIGLMAGAFIGFRYLVWELNALQRKPMSAPKPKAAGKVKIDWGKVQPYLGVIMLVLGLVAFRVYANIHYTDIGGLLLFGLLIGFVMHRSRFCFVRAFRCPFMTGDAEMVRAVAMSLFIYAFGSMIIKWRGIQPELMGVYHPFWFGSLIGGVIFGIGMVIAGGCGSGTLWRAAEGQTKLWVALVGFALSQSLVYMFLRRADLLDKLGRAIFMPDLFSWQLTMPILAIILIFWAFVAIWNEKAEKFVIF
jgi:uncharacterized membrane protein YedE/YeeE